FCWISIWGMYRFRFSIARDPSVRFDRAAFVLQLKVGQLGSNQWSMSDLDRLQAMRLPLPVRFVLWLDDHQVLPDAWLYGLLYTYNAALRRHAYLMGMHSVSGWWYYFPLAMLFKTPLAVLAAMAVLVARGAV